MEPGAAAGDDAGVGHEGEVLRDVGGRAADRTRQVADRAIAAGEEIEQAKPGRLAEDAEPLRDCLCELRVRGLGKRHLHERTTCATI